MKTQQELLEQMRNTLDFETDECVQTAAILNLQERRDELIELHRLADIGRATEIAFKQGYYFVLEDDDCKVVSEIYQCELLEWSKDK